MSRDVPDRGTGSRHDWRLPLAGLAAWCGGLLAAAGPGWSVAVVPAALLALALALGGARLLPAPAVLTASVLALVALAVGGAALARAEQVRTSPLRAMAQDHALVEVRLLVTGDPREIAGRFADGVLVRARVLRVEEPAAGGSRSGSPGTGWTLGAPVLVLADTSWADVRLGSTVTTSGRLMPPEGEDLAAVLTPVGAWQETRAPDLWWRASARVRAALHEAVAGRPEPVSILVPALVNGDDSGLSQDVQADFAATGLTHLLAVSGTNLTLVVGLLVWVARLLGVRGRWLGVVGAAGIVGFVLLARTEPSVLRAAAMGAVGLVALGPDGGRRAGRALGAAVLVLLLLDPGLATSAGFALSTLATGGIVWLAPAWRDALRAWLPAGVAEAVAVPTAAQLACTPVVAAISGQVSLVAVGANLLAEPLVAPATVLGLLGGLLCLVHPALGRPVGTVATWCVAVVVQVAHRGADLPLAAVDWGTSGAALLLLTVLTVAVARWGPVLVRRPVPGASAALVLVLVTVVPLPRPGWPPDGWLLVACDVGQGDALVLASGEGEAVVVDAGPDPTAVDDCLDDLGVERVPLLVLTHFHADHVDGVAGVLDGREVGQVEVTWLLDPPGGVEEVAAAVAGVPVRTAAAGEVQQVGDVRLQTLWPLPADPAAGPGDGSTANDASVVLLAETHGLRLLLTGDVEPPGQEALARAYPDLRVDVLKVPHHGSSHQDLELLTGLGARIAVVSVGADNDYGHPAASVVEALDAAGAAVLRTDEDGDVAVVTTGSGPAARTSGGDGS
ncbi:ComEC/Rec2 family competence protein [Nocardioides sp. GY 10127]|uniref:ComEC/Rec2 family competence protein n=1 Tax=Nocardioides sp. GY 10127 TaxID=2569762 RepID=UPI0010A9150C|nr:ComEC/Rec2 family competence protein [Nocardioides sp. GY 10127]TIC83998.1 DUF4131 domain-containing protein [Nocardioides sp. GY 10127]